MQDTKQNQLLKILGLLFLFIILGTTGYHYIEKFNWIDSFYMTSIILSTVGFGAGINELSELGRLFTVLLIMFGVGVGAFALSFTAEFIFQNPIIRSRKMEKRINGLKNHFVVCGFGRMGKIICQQLFKNKEKFVIIDISREKVEMATKAGYIVLEGNCLDDEILGKTNLKNAKGLVSVLGKEEDNLFVTLSARGASSELFIIAKNSYEFNRKKFLTAGANKVLNPYEIAGHSLANMVTRPAVVDFLEIIREGTEVDWEMDEIQVQVNAEIDGKEIRECYDREELDIIIAAIQRKNGEMKFNPRGRTKIKAGDMLIAMGYLENLKRLEKLCGIFD